ncbi:hypothetical protein BKA59DRAFT_515534 [Fusarium tricinctum]|uniref:Adenylosuccinate lyase n=1 Tax=Fusarium tricinctum TaxID=61284 RepID=A0A8K0W9C6_9HYPO|nr:hypothetical protein BKA59DRAFT_515534 [Fusarium tricinctum]
MAHAFDCQARFSAWRKLWLYLAQSQKQMGVALITDKAIEQMKNNLFITDSDLREASKRGNASTREMIMLQTFYFSRAGGPYTAGQINYAVPFDFVSRNCHAILVREALDIFIPRLPQVMHSLRKFAVSHKSRPGIFHPCRQYTQISTFGRRAADWVLDLGRDLMMLERIRDDILLCGTQGTMVEMVDLAQVLGGDVRSCEKLDVLLCKNAGFKGCYDAKRISTGRYERDLTLETGGALAQLAFGISRTLTEMAFFKTKQMDSRSKLTIAELIGRANDLALRIAADWTHYVSSGLAVGPVVIQAMFVNVDNLISGFDHLIVEIDPSSIKPLAIEELPAIVTRKITQRMVEVGHPKEVVIRHLDQFSYQTLREHNNFAIPLSFFNKIRQTLFFEPIWGEIDEMYRSELDTSGCEKTVDAVCAPGGSLDQVFEKYEASVEKVKSYQAPDKGKEKPVESSSTGSDADDKVSVATAIRWTVPGVDAPATSDYQSDSGETMRCVGNNGVRQ